jgi:hypothetical protein
MPPHPNFNNMSRHGIPYEYNNKFLSSPYYGGRYNGTTMNLRTGQELTWKDLQNNINTRGKNGVKGQGQVLFSFVENGRKFTFDLESMLKMYEIEGQYIRNPLTRKALNNNARQRLKTIKEKKWANFQLWEFGP